MQLRGVLLKAARALFEIFIILYSMCIIADSKRIFLLWQVKSGKRRIEQESRRRGLKGRQGWFRFRCVLCVYI